MPSIDPTTLDYVPDPLPSVSSSPRPPYEVTVDTIVKAPAKDRPGLYDKLKAAGYSVEEIERIRGMVNESTPALFAMPLAALAIGAVVLYFTWKKRR